MESFVTTVGAGLVTARLNIGWHRAGTSPAPTNHLRQFIELSRRFQWPQHPVRPARAIRRELVRRPGLRQPLLVNLAGLRRVHMNVAVTIRSFGFANAHCLVPAVHSGNRIGMDRKSQVLMNANIRPPNAQGISVVRFVGSDSILALQSPDTP